MVATGGAESVKSSPDDESAEIYEKKLSQRLERLVTKPSSVIVRTRRRRRRRERVKCRN
jgi:hypothetical protein